MVHPQKRAAIKPVLESTIARICEIKKLLVTLNPRSGSVYVHLDQLLFDLKYDTSILEIPVPRYFKEDDTIAVDIEFKEKTKKKKGKGKKKKKDDDEDDKKKKEPKMSLAEKQ